MVNRTKPPPVDWLSDEHVTQGGQSDLPDLGQRGTGKGRGEVVTETNRAGDSIVRRNQAFPG